MNPAERVLLGFVLFTVSFFLGGIAGTVSPVWDKHPGGCVPGNAIDYRGDLDAWVDRQGRVILLAETEDQYEFCTRP